MHTAEVSVGSHPSHPCARARLLLHAGVMGGTVADTLCKLGYKVSAWTRTLRADTGSGTGIAHHAGAEQLRAFAGGVDVLVCLLPLTDATR